MIMHHLSDEPLRFGELQRRLGGLSQTGLTKQLRQIEDYGIINRTVYQEIPPKVEYSLTDLGRDFQPVLEQFKIWGLKYINALEKSK